LFGFFYVSKEIYIVIPKDEGERKKKAINPTRNNVTEIEVYGLNRQHMNTYQVPLQITGYEYEIEAVRRAVLQKKKECEEMPHEETLILMRQMDQFRKEWGVKFPFE
jgi:hypothetical protein